MEPISNRLPVLNDLFIKACHEGNIDIVKMLIERGANNWNKGLLTACKRGHIGIALLMVEHGANNWNNALKIICDREYESLKSTR